MDRDYRIAYLCRDGRAVAQFNGASTADAINKALHKLHKLTAVSWSHALKYEGWTIEGMDGRRLA
jgi:thioredoxin-like negative regulator of GroEL